MLSKTDPKRYWTISVCVALCFPAIGRPAVVRPTDCVNVRYITGVWMNKEGTAAAYLVKAPNIPANRNDDVLYVKQIDDGTTAPGTPIIRGADISDVQWTGDDKHIAMMMFVGGTRTPTIVELSTGAIEAPATGNNSLDQLTVDASASTIAYSMVLVGPKKYGGVEPTDADIARGYRISLDDSAQAAYAVKTIYIQRKTADGKWARPEEVTVEDPLTRSKPVLKYARNLSLSPDGKHLFLTYLTDRLPAEWLTNPFVRVVERQLGQYEIMCLYNLEDGTTKLAFNMIVEHSRPVWSRDSTTIFLDTHSPLGSIWEAEDIKDHRISASDVHLFAVNVTSGVASEVLRDAPNHDEGPLFELPNGDVMVRTKGASIGRFHRVGNSWHEVGSITQPHGAGYTRFVTTNGTQLIGVHESVTVPENLFSYEAGNDQMRVLTDINPQLKDLRFATTKTIQWKTKDGLDIDGILFLPPDYVPGRPYPLVVQTKGESGWFACDSGAVHYPSFAPQPLATAGILYLARSYSENWNYQNEIDHRPKGYPGGINEVVEQTDVWDSAVDTLVSQGIADPDKIGIIGFSATGWQVDFSLFHSSIHYAAATAADNVTYDVSEYLLYPFASQVEEQMYGGSPFGKARDNWKDYSISFNLDKVHTPLLMEVMGNGVHDDKPDYVPKILGVQQEIAYGLTRLKKPVELYYYPNEEHSPDHPQARLASIQRNVDWYRFWLQNYEDPDPSKTDQYNRWRHLKTLRDMDRHSSTSP